MFWWVKVEWMDGLERAYDIGGYASADEAMQQHDGILSLWMDNNKSEGSDHVATIPLGNVRSYIVSER